MASKQRETPGEFPRPDRREGRGPQPADDLPDLPALPLEQAERAARAHNDRLLMVGPGISVKGRIQSCDRLVVEGQVEATLQADEIDVITGGHFNGDVEVNTAIISGTLTGNVVVRGRLEITETGRVTGRVRYNQLMIHEGGRMSGDVQFQAIDDVLVEASERVRA
ncbi:MAG: polymer-forming cytoskeletal protein [Kiloniellales bacterium]|nr:polymer-forming cytoskeletal protein [Kiloniellales bacterium]